MTFLYGMSHSKSAVATIKKLLFMVHAPICIRQTQYAAMLVSRYGTADLIKMPKTHLHRRKYQHFQAIWRDIKHFLRRLIA